MAVTEDRGVEPWLAESVEPNDDGTVWTITTKEGITFHDGTPFDAEVVAANLEARREGALTSIAHEPLQQVEVIDERTVEVTMDQPWAQWDKSLASQSGYMESLANIDNPGSDPIGTGPFRWSEHVVDDYVLVEANPDYWREGVPHLDEITFDIIVDPVARQAALEAGDVDTIITQTPSTIVDLRDSDFTLVEDGLSDTHVVMLNASKPPFDNPIARQAVAAATDPATIIEAQYDGIVEQASGPFSEDEVWFAEDTGWTGYDAGRAGDLVQQYEDETGESLSFTLKGGQGETETLMEVLVTQWAAAGIDAEIEPVEQSAYITEVVYGDYQAGMFRNFSWADPDFNFLFWHSSTAKGEGEVSINFTQMVNDDLDAALEEGRSSFDDEARIAAYNDVQVALNDELTYVWLFHTLWGIASQPDIHGWTEAATRGFSRQDAKIWWGDLWRAD
jgi:ABC-type transport system substrate-binding protein